MRLFKFQFLNLSIEEIGRYVGTKYSQLASKPATTRVWRCEHLRDLRSVQGWNVLTEGWDRTAYLKIFEKMSDNSQIIIYI